MDSSPRAAEIRLSGAIMKRAAASPSSPLTWQRAQLLFRCCGSALVAFIGVGACTEDGVEPGDSDAATVPPNGTVGDTGLAETGLADTGSAETGLADTGLADTGMPGRPDAATPDVSRPDAAPPDDVGKGADIGSPPESDAGMPPIPDGGSIPPPDPECDLSGRWIVSQRWVAEAVGERQGTHGWFYLEVRHEGGSVTVQKGLHCGYTVTPITALGGKVDCAAAWPSFLAKNSSAGRKGTFVKSGSVCRLKLDPEVTPRGVTLPYYLDPARPLPTSAQPAQGSSPGWEDWDGDGNPGVTLNVTGLASGKIYSAQRERTTYEGDVPFASAKFKVPISVGSENIVLGRMGPALLESPSSVSTDATQHYAWFARLANDQAVGSDAEVCLAIRGLKAQLVPEGDL